MARAPNVEVLILKQVCHSLVDSGMMTGVDILGTTCDLMEKAKVHGMFCKRIIGVPSTAAKNS